MYINDFFPLHQALRSLTRKAPHAASDSTGELSSWPSEDTAAQNAHNELIERQLAAVGGTVRAVSFYYVEWTV